MANILLIPYNWQHSTIAGGEIYLMRLVKHLLKMGHSIKAIVGSETGYIDDMGIECKPQGMGIDIFRTNNDECRWADLIITHLIGSAMGYNKAMQHGKPLVFIAHNNSKNYAPRFGKPETTKVLYNSFKLRDDLFSTFGHFDGMVVHPVPGEYKRVNTGTKITLINCNHNKGGHIFAEIAKRLPQYEFLGVLGGYGEQIEAHLPNITYLPNKTDMGEVYSRTKILLAPSQFDSYLQAGSEALQCSIPVIANPCPGIVENLGDAGIFINRDNIDLWVSKIQSLMSNDTYYWRQSEICYQRSLEVARLIEIELTRFDEWLEKIPLQVANKY